VAADEVVALPLHPGFRRAWEDDASGLAAFVRQG
jgi:hypothetical protein